MHLGIGFGANPLSTWRSFCTFKASSHLRPARGGKGGAGSLLAMRTQSSASVELRGDAARVWLWPSCCRPKALLTGSELLDIVGGATRLGAPQECVETWFCPSVSSHAIAEALVILSESPSSHLRSRSAPSSRITPVPWSPWVHTGRQSPISYQIVGFEEACPGSPSFSLTQV